MMKGITPRSRVIYECRSWSCRANSKFTSCTQLSLIYRINNETSTNSSSFRAIFQQAQVRTTLPLGRRVLREEYEMSTFMMNCFASLNDDWRCKWKIGFSQHKETQWKYLSIGMSFMENRKPKTWMRIVRWTQNWVNRCSNDKKGTRTTARYCPRTSFSWVVVTKKAI